MVDDLPSRSRGCRRDTGRVDGVGPGVATGRDGHRRRSLAGVAATDGGGRWSQTSTLGHWSSSSWWMPGEPLAHWDACSTALGRGEAEQERAEAKANPSPISGRRASAWGGLVSPRFHLCPVVAGSTGGTVGWWITVSLASTFARPVSSRPRTGRPPLAQRSGAVSRHVPIGSRGRPISRASGVPSFW